MYIKAQTVLSRRRSLPIGKIVLVLILGHILWNLTPEIYQDMIIRLISI